MKTLKSSLIYLLSSIAEKGIGFFLIPLYTHFLMPDDYGTLTLLQSVIAMLVILFTMSLNGSAARFHFDGNNILRRWNYGNIFISITLISFVMSLFIFIFKKNIFELLGDIPVYPYIYYVLILGYTNAIFALYQQKLQMDYRAKQYAFQSMLKLLISIVSAIIFLKYFSMKADGVLLGLTIAGIILFSLNGFNFYKEKIKLNLHKKLLKKNLSYSIYLVPHNIASIAMQFMDRFFISNLLNLSQVGIYSLGGQLTSLIAVFSSAINNAITPTALKAYKEKNYKYLVNLADISIAFIAFIGMTLSLFSPEIIHIIAPVSFSIAWTVVPPLAFYFVVQMYYFMTSSVLFYDQRATKFVAVATMMSLIFNLILNYFLINRFGILGASYATLISMIIVNYIVIFIANKYIIVGFKHFKIHVIIIGTFIIGNMNLLHIDIISKIILFLLAVIVIYIYERNNNLMAEFIQLFRKRLNWNFWRYND